MPVGYVSAGLGALSAINSLSGGSLMGGGGGGQGGYYSGSGPPPTYIPQNQPGADTSYYNIAGQMGTGGQNLATQLTPFYNSYLSNVQANPYAGVAQTGAQESLASTYQNTLPFAYGGAYNLYNLGANATTAAPGALTANQPQIGQLQQYGSNILQTGFDPQQALYNRTQQQVLDQQNAINAMYGLNTSPYGAGVAGQTLSNFNIDWQNNQLGREQTALGAAGGAFNQAAGLGTTDVSNFGNLLRSAQAGYGGAYDLNTGAAGQIAKYASQPYNIQNQILGNQAAAAGQTATGLTGAYGLDQNTLNALAAYMKLGQSATATGQAGAAQQFGNLQSIGSAIGQIPGQPLSDAYNYFTGGGGGSQYMGYGPSGYSPILGGYGSQYSPIAGGAAGDITFAGM